MREVCRVDRVSTKRFLQILERLKPQQDRCVRVWLSAEQYSKLCQAVYSSGLSHEQVVRDMLLDFAEFGSYKIPKDVPEPTTKALKELLISKTK